MELVAWEKQLKRKDCIPFVNRVFYTEKREKTVYAGQRKKKCFYTRLGCRPAKTASVFVASVPRNELSLSQFTLVPFKGDAENCDARQWDRKIA